MKTHPASILAPRRAALLTFLLIAAVFLPTGRADNFIEYVDSSSLPGQNPAIENVSTDGSAVAFMAQINNSDGSSYSAIYYVGSPGATPVLIADTQSTMSPTGGVFATLYGFGVSGSTVVFEAQDLAQNDGIYIAQVGAGLTVASDSNTTNPLDPTGDLTGDSKLDGVYTDFDFQSPNIIFVRGNNLFTTTVTSGSAGVTALLPLHPDTPAGVPFAFFDEVQLAGNTYAVLGVDSNNNQGIYSGNIGGGAQRTVVDGSTAEPDGLGNFGPLGTFALTPDGNSVVFEGYVKGSETGLYYSPIAGGSVNTIALVGSPTPEGGTFPQGSFSHFQTEGNDGVDFEFSNTAYSTGLTGGEIVPILTAGGTIDGLTITEYFPLARGPYFEAFGQGASGTDEVLFIGTVGGSQYQTPAFFDGEVNLGSGVEFLTFPDGTPFGYYSFLTDPAYIYHFDLGYEYVFDANDGNSGVYLYDFASSDFFYTSPSFPFPYLYDFGLQSTLYYYPDTTSPGHYTANPRYFFDFATGTIITK